MPSRTLNSQCHRLPASIEQHSINSKRIPIHSRVVLKLGHSAVRGWQPFPSCPQQARPAQSIVYNLPRASTRTPNFHLLQGQCAFVSSYNFKFIGTISYLRKRMLMQRLGALFLLGARPVSSRTGGVEGWVMPRDAKPTLSLWRSAPHRKRSFWVPLGARHMALDDLHLEGIWKSCRFSSVKWQYTMHWWW